MMHEPMFSPPARYKFRSNLFSVPMPWEDIYSQLQANDEDQHGVSLPHGQEAVETMVHLCIVGGSLNLMRFVAEFVVRQSVRWIYVKC